MGCIGPRVKVGLDMQQPGQDKGEGIEWVRDGEIERGE
mgnify:CR=1 FL=1